MITLSLGFIYGTGFALTLVGGVLWLFVLNALLHGHINPLKIVGAALIWPITLSWIGYKMYKYVRAEKL